MAGEVFKLWQWVHCSPTSRISQKPAVPWPDPPVPKACFSKDGHGDLRYKLSGAAGPCMTPANQPYRAIPSPPCSSSTNSNASSTDSNSESSSRAAVVSLVFALLPTELTCERYRMSSGLSRRWSPNESQITLFVVHSYPLPDSYSSHRIRGFVQLDTNVSSAQARKAAQYHLTLVQILNGDIV